jgi:hypothetical protein
MIPQLFVADEDRRRGQIFLRRLLVYSAGPPLGVKPIAPDISELVEEFLSSRLEIRSIQSPFSSGSSVATPVDALFAIWEHFRLGGASISESSDPASPHRLTEATPERYRATPSRRQ